VYIVFGEKYITGSRKIETKKILMRQKNIQKSDVNVCPTVAFNTNKNK